MKLLWIVAALIGAAFVTAGCVSADHSWSGEFDARLKGARASAEKALKVEPAAGKTEMFQSYARLGRKLRHEGQLIEDLKAPQGCVGVQVAGLDHVKSSALFAFEAHGPDYPARLLRADRLSLEKLVLVLERIGHEAETCA